MIPSLLPIFISLCLMGICALVSWHQGHKIEKEIAIASGRVIIQLALLGLILNWLFTHSSPVFTVSVALIMTLNSAIHTSSRIKHKYAGLFLDNLLATALALWPIAFLGTQLLSQEPWWTAQNLLPLLGMMLGNSLNGLSMGIDHFTLDLKEKKEEVLSWLALGATVEEATRRLFQRSLKIALTPIMNSMLSMGIVSIPGMMTGQLLAGSSPLEAAATQIVLMFLIASGTYLGTLMGLRRSRQRLFNRVGQLC